MVRFSFFCLAALSLYSCKHNTGSQVKDNDVAVNKSAKEATPATLQGGLTFYQAGVPFDVNFVLTFNAANLEEEAKLQLAIAPDSVGKDGFTAQKIEDLKMGLEAIGSSSILKWSGATARCFDSLCGSFVHENSAVENGKDLLFDFEINERLDRRTIEFAYFDAEDKKMGTVEGQNLIYTSPKVSTLPPPTTTATKEGACISRLPTKCVFDAAAKKYAVIPLGTPACTKMEESRCKSLIKLAPISRSWCSGTDGSQDGSLSTADLAFQEEACPADAIPLQ